MEKDLKESLRSSRGHNNDRYGERLKGITEIFKRA